MLSLYVLLAGLLAFGLAGFLKSRVGGKEGLYQVQRAALFGGMFCIGVTILAIITNPLSSPEIRLTTNVLLGAGAIWAFAKNRKRLEPDPSAPEKTAIRRLALVGLALLAIALVANAIAIFTQNPLNPASTTPLKLHRGAVPTVFVDPGTNCQYLLFPTGAVPRLNSTGMPACGQRASSPTKE
jgi:hypothetical protein